MRLLQNEASPYAAMILFVLVALVACSQSGRADVVPLNGISSSIVDVDPPIEFVYQAPPSASLKGVLFFLHGCGHSATDMWPRSATCEACLGLPMEGSIAAAALVHDWAVVAVSSENRVHKCWGRRDPPRLERVMDVVVRATGAPRITAAIGASSGGSMAARMASAPTFPGIVGVVAQVMPATQPANIVTPIRFVHMRRDARRAIVVDEQVSQMQARGLDAGQLIVEPTPLTVAAFADRPNPALDPRTAMALLVAFRRDGIVDVNGNILADPRISNWRHSARPVVPATRDSLAADASPISEIMNAHWAFHEATDAYLENCLDWIDGLATATG